MSEVSYVWLTPPQAAKMLDMGTRAFYRMLPKLGEQGVKILTMPSGHKKVERRTLVAWIEKNCTGGQVIDEAA